MTNTFQSVTEVKKSKAFGYNVTTYFDLGNNIRLKVTTSKAGLCSGDMRWNTNVIGLTGVIQSDEVTIETFTPNVDFYLEVVRNHEISRATESAILDAHNEIINNFDDIYERGFNHYNAH